MRLIQFGCWALAVLAASARAAISALTSAAVLQPPLAAGRNVLPDIGQPVGYGISIRPSARTLTFTGRVAIDIEVARPTRTIEQSAADVAWPTDAISNRLLERRA